jgi:hypothetical protein
MHVFKQEREKRKERGGKNRHPSAITISKTLKIQTSKHSKIYLMYFFSNKTNQIVPGMREKMLILMGSKKKSCFAS